MFDWFGEAFMRLMWRLFAPALVIGVLIAGCATAGTTVGAREDTAFVVIENQAFNDANAYVMCGASKRRVIHQVTGLTTMKPVAFRLCSNGDLWFRVELIGSSEEESTSRVEGVRPGSLVWLTTPSRVNTLWHRVG